VFSKIRSLNAGLHTITFQNVAISITHGIYADYFQTQVNFCDGKK